MKILTILVVLAVGVAIYFAGQEKDVSDPTTPNTASSTSRPAPSPEKGSADRATPQPATDIDYGAPKKPAGWKTPQLVKVQHILLSFTGAVGEGRLRKHHARTEEEARKLAHELVRRLRNGEDMNPLVRAHTQDSAPGIYEMSLGPAPRPGVIPKSGMVKNFGDVSFSLDVGEVGLAEYDPKDSPYGFHIVKRIQ